MSDAEKLHERGRVLREEMRALTQAVVDDRLPLEVMLEQNKPLMVERHAIRRELPTLPDATARQVLDLSLWGTPWTLEEQVELLTTFLTEHGDLTTLTEYLLGREHEHAAAYVEEANRRDGI